MLILKT